MYELPGFSIQKLDLDKLPRYGAISYKAFLCRFSIATDDMGTQICYNGTFFGRFGFRNIKEAVDWLCADKQRLESCKRVFRRAYLHHFKYYFTKWYFRHLYWKIRHHFDSEFYL